LKQINQYQIIQKLNTLNEYINLWHCENTEGNTFEILTISKQESYARLLKRLIQNEIVPLLNREITGIQKNIETGYDDNNQCHFIVYEWLENYGILEDNRNSENINSIKEISKGLDFLKKENRQAHIISPKSISINPRGNTKLKFLGLFELFKQQQLFDTEYLAPNVKEWLQNRKQPRPNFQDDIYALIKSFEQLLRNRLDEPSIQILSNSLETDRTKRFPKYHDLLERLDLIPVIRTIHQKKHQKTILVKTQPEYQDDFQNILYSMNENTWILVENRLSKNKKQITGKFSTNDYNGRFFVDEQGYIFIDYKSCRDKRNDSVIQNSNSFLSKFNFDFNPSQFFNCLHFFKDEFDKLNKLAELNKTNRNTIKLWKTLPDKEREYIEERAFKAKYLKRENTQNNSSNIKFTLTKVEKEGWSRLKNLKNEEVVLFVDEQAIGKILDYHPKENFITIRDAFCTVDEIPEKGELIEDIRQETSQYKKQVEACDKFKNADVVNPAICSILATPDDAHFPQPTKLFEDSYDNFRDILYNKNLQNDEAQCEAVLEALNQKPVYLIQGPPGTGKTTVIVELIQQILRKHKETKILVTSQSNLAVDNVLEKFNQINIDEGKDLRFMRLASGFALENHNISNDIMPHSFENKLKNWIAKTENNSKTYFDKNFTIKNKQKHLIEFYGFYSNLDKQNGWNIFNNRLKVSVNYIKRLFENAKNFKEVKSVFEKVLGKEYLKLKNLQRDWFAFLGETMIDDGRDRKKSMLNNGSTEIDFLTALLQQTNIIGATCIHIASSQYSRVDFKFDYVVMDESSKASPAETLVPINMGRNIILIGDHKQLPPVITREEVVKKKIKTELEDNGLDFDKEFGESLFERLILSFENDPAKTNYYKMLDIQYRMPKQIGTLISKFFYNGKLKNPSPEVISDYDEQKHHGLNIKKNTSVIFISTSNEANPNDNNNKFNRQNKCNVSIIKKTLSQLNELYKNNLKREKPLSIGIIAGYRGQVELLKRSINLSGYKNFVEEIKESEQIKKNNLIEINTVDKFQGAERDIIIYDIVRSSKGESNIGFLDDYRRINVAFSRVKSLLIIVGDSDYVLKRAKLNSKSKFKEFKLKDIIKDLEKQDLIVNNLKEILQ